MVSGISTHTLTWSVTDSVIALIPVITISTHTLTWSVTDRLVIGFNRLMISTHTLTWSVTSCSGSCCGRLAFQLTRSRGA